jgi:hypothetical protein
VAAGAHPGARRPGRRAGHSDPALQADREEAVVFVGENTDPDCRPRLEVTHRLKSDVGFGALVRLALGRDFGVDVV